MNRHIVGEKLRPSERSAEGSSEDFRRFSRSLPFVDKEVEGLSTKARGFNDAGLGATGGAKELFSDVHDYNGKDYLDRVKRCISGHGKGNVYPLGMTDESPKQKPWRQHELLRAWVDRWISEKAHSPSQLGKRAECAKALGIGVQSLKQYCAGLQIPGRLLQASIVSVFKEYGAKPSDLVDEQGALDDDEDARTFANIMFHEAKDLSPEQRKAILDMVRAGRALGQQRKESGD